MQKFVLTGVGNYDKNKGTTAELITLRLENTGDGIGTNKGKDYYIGFMLFYNLNVKKLKY